MSTSNPPQVTALIARLARKDAELAEWIAATQSQVAALTKAQASSGATPEENQPNYLTINAAGVADALFAGGL